MCKSYDDRLTEALNSEFAKEATRHAAEWRELHKDDPCEQCGSAESVVIVPTGCLARLTSLCPTCLKRLEETTAAYWRGHDDALESVRARSFWKRLFG